MSRPIIIRDPLWDTVQADAVAVRVIDAPAFQRLRHIKQLGLAHLVYPGATHTRFDHAVGVYHLACRALRVMGSVPAMAGVDAADRELIPLAALLHDIGHYPFSHALEELEPDRIPGHHEQLAARFLADPEITAALEHIAPDGPHRVAALIRGESASPLQGLVSGSLDLDKIEYLKRDARFCGVPYGEVDVDRLLHALTLLEDPATGRLEVGVHEKGVAALESLLFAKYQMFRNVYWHHAVRAATVLYTRLVEDALDAGLIEAQELVGQTDEGLLYLLASRAAQGGAAAASVAARVAALRERRLPKRAVELAAADIDGGADWLSGSSTLKRRVEDRLAQELDIPRGGVYVDYPAKTAMFSLDLLVSRRDGRVLRLGPAGRAGLIGLPVVADALYRTARVLRVFTEGGRRDVDARAAARLAGLSSSEIEARLDAGQSLLER